MKQIGLNLEVVFRTRIEDDGNEEENEVESKDIDNDKPDPSRMHRPYEEDWFFFSLTASDL